MKIRQFQSLSSLPHPSVPPSVPPPTPCLPPCLPSLYPSLPPSVLHQCRRELRYTLDHVMSWTIQMAIALEYIHSQNMLHRDIKPSKYICACMTGTFIRVRVAFRHDQTIVVCGREVSAPFWRCLGPKSPSKIRLSHLF